MKYKIGATMLALLALITLTAAPAHAAVAKPAFDKFVTVNLVAVPSTGGGGGGSGCGDVCYYNDANFSGSHQAIIGIVRGTCYNMSSTFAGHISSHIINVSGVVQFRVAGCTDINQGAQTTSLLTWPWNDAIRAYGIPN